LKELIDHIPFLDVIVVGTLALFLVIGWRSGAPRILMVLGSLYTGFLLASIYYHLFAVALARTFSMRAGFLADVLGFFILDIMVTALMIGLMIGLFGHIEIKGRLAVFDKVLGSLGGFLAGLIVLGISINLLHVPYQTHIQDINAADAPVVRIFNDGYDRSALSPLFVKAAPAALTTVTPMLPPEAREIGTVPLLAGDAAQK
jgi:uncharacterized membrane protein required for colicin V production